MPKRLVRRETVWYCSKEMMKEFTEHKVIWKKCAIRKWVKLEYIFYTAWVPLVGLFPGRLKPCPGQRSKKEKIFKTKFLSMLKWKSQHNNCNYYSFIEIRRNIYTIYLCSTLIIWKGIFYKIHAAHTNTHELVWNSNRLFSKICNTIIITKWY